MQNCTCSHRRSRCPQSRPRPRYRPRPLCHTAPAMPPVPPRPPVPPLPPAPATAPPAPPTLPPVPPVPPKLSRGPQSVQSVPSTHMSVIAPRTAVVALPIERGPTAVDTTLGAHRAAGAAGAAACTPPYRRRRCRQALRLVRRCPQLPGSVSANGSQARMLAQLRAFSTQRRSVSATSCRRVPRSMHSSAHVWLNVDSNEQISVIRAQDVSHSPGSSSLEQDAPSQPQAAAQNQTIPDRERSRIAALPPSFARTHTHKSSRNDST